MNAQHELKHQPLTAEELRRRAPEIDRAGREPAAQLKCYVAGRDAPDTKLMVHRAGYGWSVEVKIDGARLTYQVGQTAGTIRRPTSREVGPLQLDGFLPADAAVRTQPITAPAAPPIRLRGKKGQYTPLAVFPGDGRRLLTDNSWPWRLTGLVTTSDGGAGSGVLVGDRLLLTAHHMRPSVSIGQGSWWVKFTPNYDSGNEPFGSSFVSDLRHFDAESDPEYRVGHDFMLCRLYEPLGHQIGFLGSTTFADGWRGQNVWDNIGYPDDVGGGQRPAVQFNQNMEDDYEDDGAQYLETEASLNHGNSGGPFFSWFTDGQVRLCGVVSGETSFGGDIDNSLAGGDDMVNLINWGRANWPA